MHAIIRLYCFFIFLSSRPLHNHNVESYALNPRAIHPDGKIPSAIQAKRRSQSVRETIFKRKDDDGDGRNIVVLIDGNNIRNSFGFERMSALRLTQKISSWSIGIDEADTATATSMNDGDDSRINNRKQKPKLQSICIWDGGKQRSSQTHTMENSNNPSTLSASAYSGPDGNADDLMVQCCSYLSSVDVECTPQQHQPQPQHHDHLTVVIFTSDANLANRCQMQLMMGESPIDYQIYHSIHLCHLLGVDDDDDNENDNYSVGSNQEFGIAPDWEREERRKSVDELQIFLDRQQDNNIDGNDNYKGDEHSLECIDRINNWINDGLKGCEVGRVTKGGSILYTYCQRDT